MCDGCNSSAQASLGDKQIALKDNPRFETDNGQDEKWEGQAPEPTASGAEAQYTGRQ